MNRIAFLLIIVFISLVGCTSSRDIVYLNNTKGDTANLSSLLNSKLEFETPIQKNDQLWITVGGPNAADLIALNSAMGMVGAGGGAMMQQGGAQILGYLVEADGTIKMPYVGKIKAVGLTRIQLEEYLQKAFSDYTKDPIVNVRFMNYRVTVLGEVSKPGTYTIPTERMTILEAIGMAGDLTIFGRRNEVLVLREIEGKREFGRVDLLSREILNSPYYYLRTNDVVYVEPAPARFFARERLPQFLTVASGALSIVAIIISITK